MKLPRIAVLGATAVAFAATAFATAAPASADYGKTAVFQIALSDNIPGPMGGGLWIWYELSSDGTGDYQGSDCGHQQGPAVPDAGSVTWAWSADHSHLVISGTKLNGLGGFPVVVTVPSAFGHYTGTDATFVSLPPFIPSGIGFSQLEVAP